MSENKRNVQPRGNMPQTSAKAGAKERAPRPGRKKKSAVARFFRRFFLVIFTVLILAVVALALVMNLVFNGPSTAARDVLTMSLTEGSATKWIPGLFMDESLVEDIRKQSQPSFADDSTDTSQIIIRNDTSGADSDEWANHPDGIYIEEYKGKTFTAHIMVIKDPSRVYMAVSSEKFSTSVPGTRITEQIEKEGAVAAINAGAFYDDGTADSIVGSVPAGLVIVDGEVRWNAYKDMVPKNTGGGFAGFNKDNILVVAQNMTPDEAMAQNIMYGCEFGPVLIMNGEVNSSAYNDNSGYNPRTALGQRADGAVVFLCIDGRQAGGLGGTYGDVIDILQEYGCVNACNMDGGSSSVMLYRDPTTQEVSMINNYSLLQSQPRRMPNFWMVRPAA